MADSGVGRNKAIQARSARWRFRRAREVFAGKASVPRQLLSYMDVMNAENAGAFFCPASPKAHIVGALPPASMQSCSRPVPT